MTQPGPEGIHTSTDNHLRIATNQLRRAIIERGLEASRIHDLKPAIIECLELTKMDSCGKVTILVNGRRGAKAAQRTG